MAKRYLSLRDKPYKEAPFDHFFEFIDPQADRYSILSSLIDHMALNSLVLPLSGNRHFIIFPKGRIIDTGSGFPFRGQSPTVLVAHYDRVEGSPGANDNSASVLLLLKAARRLIEQETDYWIIIFTDKEELSKGESVENQGSFSLAEYLRKAGLADSRIYIFDACGSGDTLVISTTTDYLLRNDNRRGVLKARQLIQGLRTRALDNADYLNLPKVLCVPTPFSDDAGFFKAGLTAQTITVLPGSEAGSYASLLRKRPEFADFLIAGDIKSNADRLLVPETWRSLNGPSDSYLKLTPQFYDRIVRFAASLCE
jgi:hypothetical protein